MTALPTRYDPEPAEAAAWRRWVDAGAFESDFAPDGAKRPGAPEREPFTVVIPPPNITGRLHMGHALNNTIQDALVRYHRMAGRDALWVPGTDHAGISTQTVVRRHLDAEGVDYRELGRDEFVERVWKWRERYGGVILRQLEKLGCSCDFRRTRFTMDDGLSRAVRTVFKSLYDRGLIYRGLRVVNWCPVDRTALSDDEVETAAEGEPGSLWRIRYPLAGAGAGAGVVIATTRPETLFGDVAVAVHPEDGRYAGLVGKHVELPLTGREIPVIADSGVARDFGTGCLKITPAHDPHDFEIGGRHGLEPMNVMNEDATMNDAVPEPFRGLDRYRAREEAVAALDALGLLEGVEDHRVPLGRAQRSGAPIEYRLSSQWFVRMRPLADRALRRCGFEHGEDGWRKVRDGEPKFHPARWENVYARWLIEIRDWTISRQIWWGHRIPAWRNRETDEVLVDVDVPERVRNEPDAWRQDEDVLDTWFSSWLWPMSTLGWPSETPDLKRYYPTSVLSTDKGILFFWVARMNFAGLEMTGRTPYSDVYIHPTVLDERGAVMSKSRGNGIDPLAVIEGATLEELKRPVREARPPNMAEMERRIARAFPDGFEGVGADALRFTLVRLTESGQEMRLSLPKFHEIGRRFITKLWNASRFSLLSIQGAPGAREAGDAAAPAAADRWIASRTAACAAETRRAFESFDFAGVGAALYRFIWNDFCDWYVELLKPRLRAGGPGARQAASAAGRTLADILALLHPVAPFITEHLWGRLLPAMDEKDLWDDARPESDLLARAAFPEGDRPRDPGLEADFGALRRLVAGARRLRADAGLAPGMPLDVRVLPDAEAPGLGDLLRATAAEVMEVGKFASLSVRDPGDESASEAEAGAVAIVDPAFEARVPLGGRVEMGPVLRQIEKQRTAAASRLERSRRKLADPRFAARAAPEVLAEHRERARLEADQCERLGRLLAELRANPGTE